MPGRQRLHQRLSSRPASARRQALRNRRRHQRNPPHADRAGNLREDAVSGRMAARLLLGLAIVSLWLPLLSAHAQSERKPTAREVAAIRTCAAKYQDDVDEGERQCVFKLVATPCITPEDATTQGQSFCYHLE